MSVSLIVLYATVVATDWVAVAKQVKPLEYVAKPLAMVVLIIAALGMDPADEAARSALVVALAFSMGGDVALMIPGPDGERRPAGWFTAGIALFLLGHLAYVAGFWLEGTELAWLALGGIAACAVIGFVGVPIVRAVQGSAEPGLAAPVAVYIGVIALMVCAAIGTGDPWAIAGAGLFAFSDATIARERFIRKATFGRLAIVVTYHAAQFGLLMSFAA